MSAAQSSVCRCGWPLDLCYFIRKLEKNKIKSEILLIVEFLTYKMYQTIEMLSIFQLFDTFYKLKKGHIFDNVIR